MDLFSYKFTGVMGISGALLSTFADIRPTDYNILIAKAQVACEWLVRAAV
jgi:hypothetical protein